MLHLKMPKGVNKPFRFEKSWYSYPDLDSFVNDSRNKNTSAIDPMAIIVMKLRRLGVELKIWNKERVGDIS